MRRLVSPLPMRRKLDIMRLYLLKPKIVIVGRSPTGCFLEEGAFPPCNLCLLAKPKGPRKFKLPKPAEIGFRVHRKIFCGDCGKFMRMRRTRGSHPQVTRAQSRRPKKRCSTFTAESLGKLQQQQKDMEREPLGPCTVQRHGSRWQLISWRRMKYIAVRIAQLRPAPEGSIQHYDAITEHMQRLCDKETGDRQA